MMSNAVVSLVLAAGSATWLFNYFQRTSGNNTGRSVKAAAISGVVIFGVCLSILSLLI